MKKIVKLISLILSIALFLGGCGIGKNGSSSKEIIQNDSEYINLTMIKPETINPILNTDKSVSYVLDLVYDSLFEFDENYNIQSKLVDSYEIASDNKSVKINLKDNVKWHDGTDLTANDIRYTVSYIKSHKESAYNSLIYNLSRVVVNSDTTCTIYFKNAYSFSLETLIFPIVSQSNLGKVGDKASSLSKNNLIGCGAYKIKEYEDREYIILEKFDEYYNKKGSNNDREIYVKMVPDASSQIQMVLSNDSDMTKVTLGDISKFTDVDKFSIEKYQSRSYEYVLFNYENLYLRNKDIRKALAFAIDRQSIITEDYSDRAMMVNFPLSYNSNYYDKELKPLSYNTDNAKNYLKKAVISLAETKEKEKTDKTNKNNKNNNSNSNNNDNSGDNQGNSNGNQDSQGGQTDTPVTPQEPVNTEGTASVSLETKLAPATTRNFKDVKESEVRDLVKELDFKIIVNRNNGERLKAARRISENLEELNIKVQVAALSDDAMEDALESQNYDLALIGCELPAVSDASYIFNQLAYNDAKLQTYFARLKNAKSEEEIKTIYKEIQKYVRDNALFVSFGILDDYVVLNNRLNGDLNSNDFNIYRGISSFKIN